jgi:competence protein ComGC
MSKSNSNHKGFALVEGLLILIIVLLVGFIGYYVYNSQKEADNTQIEAVSNVQTTKSKTAEAKPLIGSGDSAIYDLSELATTSEQKQIVAAVKVKCVSDTQATDKTVKTTDVVVLGPKDTFTEPQAYAVSGDYARIAAACQTKPVQQEDGTAVFVLHKSSSKWALLYSGQMIPNCSQVDGKNISSKIVADCYDEKTLQDRAPN